MEYYSALLIPSVLTVLLIVLSWLYIKNAGRLAGEWWSVKSNSKKSAAYSNPVKTEDEKPTQNDDDDGNLRAEVAPYLINPGDIQEVVEQIPLDNDLIEQEMKAKGIENIQTYYKKSRLHIKEMEGMLSGQEKEQERIAQRKQLEEIYKLMEQEKEKFGLESMDEIEDQMKLYNVQ